MLKNKKNSYFIFGNPVNHSKSPVIHALFAKQINIKYFYYASCVPIKNFSEIVLNFFKNSVQGANITSPFKIAAYQLSNKLTMRAKISKSVNTLKKMNNGDLLGDNTDGIGLLSDLLRLNFIKRNSSILIIGAGGAVRGILFPLLSFGCSVFILNRTVINAKILVLDFKQYGKIDLFDMMRDQVEHFDLIINATTRNSAVQENFLPMSLISSRTYFYDMNYGSKPTSFLSWFLRMGGIYYSDGIGMLVFQAAHSCFLWHNRLPLVNYIIKSLANK